MSATASAVISPMQVAGLLLQGWRWILVAILAGAIVGVGATKRLSAVRWGVAGNIIWAWILTIPISAVISAAIYSCVHYCV